MRLLSIFILVLYLSLFWVCAFPVFAFNLIIWSKTSPPLVPLNSESIESYSSQQIGKLFLLSNC